MGYLSHRVGRNEIKPGDHIYTWRTAFTYSHHGIYVGENKVIHFTSDQQTSRSVWNLSSSLLAPSSWFTSTCIGFSQPECGQNCVFNSCVCTYTCGFHQPDSGVTLSCLNGFIGTGSLYLYHYGVDILTHVTKLRGGTCTIKPSDPPQDVIHRAIYLLKSETGYGNYNLGRNNCEDFALYCKTGLMVYDKSATGSSGQVNSLVNAQEPILNSVAQNVAWKVVQIGAYCCKRYKSDIGVRDDVVKVRVENVTWFRENFGT